MSGGGPSRDDGFLSRWSRRKAEARTLREPEADDIVAAPAGHAAPTPAADAVEARMTDAPTPPAADHRQPPAHAATPPPTLDDVAALSRDADFSRFVAPGVDDGVKQAALRKLFSDPHFNVMDGLDTYIDDYNKADPLPASMLRKMTQAAFLGLFREDDENPDLRLQPDDADRRPGTGPGDAGEPGRDGDGGHPA